MAEFVVTFHPNAVSSRVAEGTTIHEAAAAAGLPLRAPCGGQGRCGKCAVQAGVGVDSATAVETRLFGEEELAAGWRLACQARVIGDAEINVPSASLLIEHRIQIEGVAREVLVEPAVTKIPLRLPRPSRDDASADLNRVMQALGGGVRPPRAIATLRQLPGLLRASNYEVTAVVSDGVLASLEAGDTTEACYGAAVDIGTTTVVVYLCHLPSGEVVGVSSGLNPQARYGEDVISRLQMAISEQEGLTKLSGAVRKLIDDLIGQAASDAGVARESIYEVVVVGNTTMCHLFLEVSPIGLAAVPFAPSFSSAQTVGAEELGLRIDREGRVYVVPNIGGFVGADTVGVIISSELEDSRGLRVAVDIGTNGEIVVAENGELYACSTAAGPAFEGARISQGMRAAAGAIDEVTIDHDVFCHVLGDVPAVGLCGSGLVDAIAEMVKVGLIDETGRLRKPEETGSLPEKVRQRLVQNDKSLEFVLAGAEESGAGKVAVSARDVRELQLAKGAIYAGIGLLLDKLGRKVADIEKLLLAGAFGNYIRRESAVRIGLVPALPAERIESIGNAAGAGARLALCSVALRRKAEEVARRTRHVELSEEEGFYSRFADAMALRPMADTAVD